MTGEELNLQLLFNSYYPEDAFDLVRKAGDLKNVDDSELIRNSNAQRAQQEYSCFLNLLTLGILLNEIRLGHVIDTLTERYADIALLGQTDLTPEVLRVNITSLVKKATEGHAMTPVFGSLDNKSEYFSDILELHGYFRQQRERNPVLNGADFNHEDDYLDKLVSFRLSRASETSQVILDLELLSVLFQAEQLQSLLINSDPGMQAISSWLGNELCYSPQVVANLRRMTDYFGKVQLYQEHVENNLLLVNDQQSYQMLEALLDRLQMPAMETAAAHAQDRPDLMT